MLRKKSNKKKKKIKLKVVLVNAVDNKKKNAFHLYLIILIQNKY